MEESAMEYIMLLHRQRSAICWKPCRTCSNRHLFRLFFVFRRRGSRNLRRNEWRRNQLCLVFWKVPGVYCLKPSTTDVNKPLGRSYSSRLTDGIAACQPRLFRTARCLGVTSFAAGPSRVSLFIWVCLKLWYTQIYGNVHGKSCSTN